MNIDKSLDNLNLLNFIIYVLIFLCVCSAIVVFLIMPSFKSYEQSRARLQTQDAINSDARSKLNISENRLYKLNLEYSRYLEKFTNDFSEEDFKKLLDKNFKEVDLLIMQSGSTNEYPSKDIKVNALMQDPNALYSFIDSLKEYPNLLKIDYPLLLESVNQNDIKVQINLKLYSAPNLQR